MDPPEWAQVHVYSAERYGLGVYQALDMARAPT